MAAAQQRQHVSGTIADREGDTLQVSGIADTLYLEAMGEARPLIDGGDSSIVLAFDFEGVMKLKELIEKYLVYRAKEVCPKCGSCWVTNTPAECNESRHEVRPAP